MTSVVQRKNPLETAAQMPMLVLDLMTISILTGHPALPYVLQRTAPAGVVLSGPVASSRRQTNREILYRVTIQSRGIARDVAIQVLPMWIANQLEAYGARKLAIDGKAVAPRDPVAIKRSIIAALKRVVPSRRRVVALG